MAAIKSIAQSKTIKSIVNLLIPVSLMLSFIIIKLFELLVKANFVNHYPELHLSEWAQNLIYSGFLGALSLVGAVVSTISLFAWLIMVIKSRGERYLISLNKAVLTVLGIWVSGTLVIPFVLYCIYKPIFEPIIK